MKHILAFYLILFSFFSWSQSPYPENYFNPPLKIPIILSGTFGELRSNHFHSGLDIKTLGKQGIPIFAPADGYVSRIKVQQYGYGKALYLTHPNGYTTVYAHLKRFGPNIQEYVKRIQYQKENYTTGNLFPKPEEFPVSKGELIGYTGDTGSSGGPHLHYEIRNTKSEHIINPMFFGLVPKDTIVPIIDRVLAYPLSEDARINNTSQKTKLPLKQKNKNEYITNPITASGTIGFGIKTFDRLNKAYNKNGVFSIQMLVNGQPVYYHDLETFSFAESKYINLLIDYEHYKTHKNRIQKTHKHDNNPLSIYENLVNNGKITVENNHNYTVEIIVKDFKNNYSKITIPVKGVNSATIFKQKDSTAYKINKKEFHKFSQENVTIAFPKNTFYDDFYLDFSVAKGIATIHKPTVPLAKRFTLTFDTSHLTNKQKQQVYIANVSKPKYSWYSNTKKKDNKVYTNTRTLGKYKLKFDISKPIVTLYNFKNNQWISKHKTLKVKIKDTGTGIKNYKATIDGQWVLMEYNHKKGILTYDFNDKKLVGSKHLFKIVVSDHVGNTKTLSATFFKKQN